MFRLTVCLIAIAAAAELAAITLAITGAGVPTCSSGPFPSS